MSSTENILQRAKRLKTALAQFIWAKDTYEFDTNLYLLTRDFQGLTKHNSLVTQLVCLHNFFNT